VTLEHDKRQPISMSENLHDYERRPLSQAS
jgi:hypothetical protein